MVLLKKDIKYVHWLCRVSVEDHCRCAIDKSAEGAKTLPEMLCRFVKVVKVRNRKAPKGVWYGHTCGICGKARFL